MELKEKWVLKEGWCWDDDVKEAQECLLIRQARSDEYLCLYGEGYTQWFKNFSETDPNQEELKVGEFAYFWDEDWLENECVVYGRLYKINTMSYSPYEIKGGLCYNYKYCSHINPLLK